MQMIDDFLQVLTNNERIIKKWGERKKSNNKSQLKTKIKRILLYLSGNDFISLIGDILNKEEADLISLRYVNALEGLAVEINKQKKTKKHYFIRPLRKAKFKLKEIKRLKFKVSKKLWRSCINPNERCIGGKKSLDFKVINQINEYLDLHSRPAANRVIYRRIYGRTV